MHNGLWLLSGPAGRSAVKNNIGCGQKILTALCTVKENAELEVVSKKGNGNIDCWFRTQDG